MKSYKKIIASTTVLLMFAFALPLHVTYTEDGGIYFNWGAHAESDQKMQEILYFARAIFSESNKNQSEQVLVAWVIRNRVEAGYRGKTTYEGVVMDPGQFSGLNSSDKRYKLNMSLDYDTDNPNWQQAIEVARAVYDAPEHLRSIPNTVRHFYSPSAVSRTPSWARNKEAVFLVRDTDKNHTRFAFFKDIK